MTNDPAAGPSEPAGEAMPYTLDAVASLLRRRGTRAEDEALALAFTVRDLDIALRAALAENASLQERIAELEASNG